MRGRILGAGVIVAVSGFIGAFSYDQVVKPAVADAGPPAGLATREQNLDSSGSIRVHEQGTATVIVGNFPATQPVSGTVMIGNQPSFAFDPNGNLRVATVGGGAGRSAAVLLNVTIQTPPTPTPNFFISSDLSVGQFTELSLDAIVPPSPCIFVIEVQRKASFGQYFTIDSVALTLASESASESIGAGASKNATFGSTVRLVTSMNGPCLPGIFPVLAISLVGK